MRIFIMRLLKTITKFQNTDSSETFIDNDIKEFLKQFFFAKTKAPTAARKNVIIILPYLGKLPPRQRSN